LWEPTTALLQASYQLLVNHQNKAGASPLGRALLAIKDEDAGHIALVSQSELLLHQHSSSGAHTATVSLLKATLSAHSESGRLDPSGSPPPALTDLLSARSHPAAEQEAPPSLSQTSPLRPEFSQHS
jgi:hypothetical protein